ncbi:MAG TPA: 3-hydroxybenzoate 6-hydroxylase 1 [Hyphomicrobiaceae bacterium MAG_BT-2024]
MEHLDHTVIVGGGIAGLTLAITLAHCGLRSTVLETQQAPKEEGAGIQLGPNATRILRELSILDTLNTSAITPESIIVADARSNHTISRLPLGSWMVRRYGAPYIVAHRADLQSALLQHAKAHAKIDLRFGSKLRSINHEQEHSESQDSTLKFILNDGHIVSTPIMVGADGIWSTVRSAFKINSSKFTYSGMTAARAVINFNNLPKKLQHCVTHVWLAPDAHIVMYPIRRNLDVALVVVTPAPQPEQGWGIDIDKKEILTTFKSIHHDVSAVLQQTKHWKQWALFDPEPLPSWSEKQMVLIGDAAHPILPFMAQGGAMAIEDGYVLGHLISEIGLNTSKIFSTFETIRRDRVTRMQDVSRKNGNIYHLGDLMAKSRNMVLRLIPPSLLMQQYSWIYNWRYYPN